MGNFVFVFFFFKKKIHTQIKTRWSPGAPPADLRQQKEGREDAWSCAKHSALGLQHCDVALEALGAWSQRYKCNKNSHENEPLNSVWSWSVMASGNPPGQTGPFYPLHCSDSKTNLMQLSRPETEQAYSGSVGFWNFLIFRQSFPSALKKSVLPFFAVSSHIGSSAASTWCSSAIRLRAFLPLWSDPQLMGTGLTPLVAVGIFTPWTFGPLKA